MKVRNIIAAIIAIASVVLSLWLAIGVMFIGGINAAILGFTTGNISMGVWGIIRAVFFEFGFFPLFIGYIAALFVAD